MAEQITSILSEKFNDTYGRSKFVNNFATADELTVTITLEEYRDLVSHNATSEHAISKIRRESYDIENENRDLKKQIAELKQRIVDLTSLNCPLGKGGEANEAVED